MIDLIGIIYIKHDSRVLGICQVRRSDQQLHDRGGTCRAGSRLERVLQASIGFQTSSTGMVTLCDDSVDEQVLFGYFLFSPDVSF